jgi:hypothetical protein
VLEHFECNTTYGIKKTERSSNTHIINPIGKGERGVSHFCNTIADFGKFNLISNELFASGEILPDRKFKFDINPRYNAPVIEDAPDGFKDFCSDLQSTISKGDWTFIFRSSASHRDFDIHVLFGGEKGNTRFEDVESPTVSDRESLNSFIQQLSEAMIPYNLKVGTHEEFSNKSPNLLHQYIYKHTTSNVVTIFMSIDAICSEDHRYYRIIKAITESIKEMSSASK